MDYLYQVDLASRLDANGRGLQRLFQRESEGVPYALTCIQTPPGGGSPKGTHTHPYDQVYHLISGRMHVEVDGKEQVLEAGGVAVFPAGVPHRNWNVGPEPTVHLAIIIGKDAA